MTLEFILAGVILVALTVYVLTGGADFGGGVWDLFARGERAKAQREAIAHAIGPIWEANHVWLIVVVVLLFVGFPKAFAAMMTALHIPLTLMLVGIVLRGSSFVFRAYDVEDDDVQRRWSLIFSIASVITPITLGVSVGAIVSGDIRIDLKTLIPKSGFFASWMAPFPLFVGFFTLVLFSFLAAVYLTVEAKDPELKEDFRLRALGSGVAAGILAWVCFGLSAKGAPLVYKTLSQASWSLPFQLVTGGVALAALATLWFRKYALARIFAGAQVTFILWGWAAAHYPYIIVPDLTFKQAAALPSVLKASLYVLGAGAVLLLPSFWYLFKVFKLEQEETSS
ncbi:MAG TPA: cytochrome BD ubiquinol oxidase subunit II [Myxococcales bacterium]|nr:cytochrome BD ubiquinol oxidase subunit II [Deltaproteobacteria bacterium]MBU52913.1 cytochrome BD ubiquinol oxidase subunit II [Deltaproteobacteria bacterium]HAA56601.1 cytochrome BD ubiquinol oxidase subunit II [Myxococcales bacterium]|tara:strand:+ start:7160 stop:8176 length:1017 start_codon:yes stop_codon:yes gene_type:complete